MNPLPAAALVVVLAWSGAAGADEVWLHNGSRFAGAIVEESESTLIVLSEGVRWTFARTKVKRVERDAARRQRTLAAGDAGRRGAPGRLLRDNVASAAPQVVMYTTSWCPACKKARTLFRQLKIRFVEKDVERDPIARAEYLAKSRAAGLTRPVVPTLVVGGKVVRDFTQAQVLALPHSR